MDAMTDTITGLADSDYTYAENSAERAEIALQGLLRTLRAYTAMTSAPRCVRPEFPQFPGVMHEGRDRKSDEDSDTQEERHGR